MCQVCCISDENCHIDVVRPQMSHLLSRQLTPLANIFCHFSRKVFAKMRQNFVKTVTPFIRVLVFAKGQKSVFVPNLSILLMHAWGQVSGPSEGGILLSISLLHTAVYLTFTVSSHEERLVCRF
jgi:hypothetical protein